MAKSTLGEKYYIHSCVVTCFLFLFYLLGVNNSFLYSSILDYKNLISDTFDGTVYPIEFVPSPMLLTYEQRKQKYEKIDSKYFIKTPHYHPKTFGKDVESLSPGSKEYYEVITQRLLYTVPYIGSYNFDYKEFSGSHPGIDIVVPEGTPIRNIANGVVVDIGSQPGGFGNYVLIKHNWIPLPDGKKGNAYSLYAHMLRSTVEIGTKIKKGQLLGYVGQTGTATTPHLHFQMDVESAPYSPYWPFTTLDMKLAGVGFFEGVNIGLGKENAMRYTINPLKFVNDYLNETIAPPLLVGSGEEDITQKEENISSPEETKPEPNLSQETQKEPETKPSVSPTDDDLLASTQIVIESDSKIVKKEQLVTKNVELLSTISPEIVLGDHGVIQSFDTNKLLALNNDDLLESLEKVDESVSTSPLDIDYPVIDPKDDQDSASTFEALGDEQLLEDESIEIADDVIVQTGSISLFEDIDESHILYPALKYFKEKGVVSGFLDGTFRVKSNVTRVESLKMILLAFDIKPISDEASQFKDINTKSWENTYVNAAIKRKIISLENTYFSPMRNVSRVEGLKLILLLSGQPLESSEESIEIKDMESTHWAHRYVQYAIKNNLLSLENGKIYPDKPLTRGEIISILFEVLKK